MKIYASSEKYNKETVHPGGKYFSTNPVAYKNIIRDACGISLQIDGYPQTDSAFN